MDKFCDELEFTTAVNTLTTAIAARFETVEELAAAAAVFVQIGDTMAAIAARRALCEKEQNNIR